MPLIWCSISAHGYGHAAQAVPVLNALGRRLGDLRIIVRTQVPRTYFDGRLVGRWEHSDEQQDVGCIQHGPLDIDEPATWRAHDAFEAAWAARLDAECRLLEHHRPDLVISAISYLSVAAAARIGIKAVAVGSLSWDTVLGFFESSKEARHRELITSITERYATADLLLRAAPALQFPAFPHQIDIRPIAEPLPAERDTLRKAVGALGDERVVLVGFGGIPIDGLPLAAMDAMPGYRFVVGGRVAPGLKRLTTLDAVGLPFRSVLSSCDLLVTKPGYSTFVEAVAVQVPILYVRRYNFADEQTLIEYAERYGRARELSRKDFEDGAWSAAMQDIRAAAPPSEAPPPPRGAEDAAEQIVRYL